MLILLTVKSYLLVALINIKTVYLLNYLPELDYWRRVFAYDFDGNILWQVENPWYFNPHTGVRSEYDDSDRVRFPGGDCVGSIWYEKDGDYIVAAGRIGYRLDTDTGKLLEIVWRER